MQSSCKFTERWLTVDDMNAIIVRPIRRVPARDLSRNTASLLDAVLAGETVEITRDGRPVALLTPIGEADLDLAAAIDAGILDPAVLDSAKAGEADAWFESVKEQRRISPENLLSQAIIDARQEERT
jgi:prevent-host-death family protein